MRASILRASFVALVFSLLSPSTALPGPTLKASTTINGTSDQRGRSVAVSDGALFVSGDSVISGDYDGLVARYALPLANAASPVWSKTWCELAAGVAIETMLLPDRR